MTPFAPTDLTAEKITALYVAAEYATVPPADVIAEAARLVAHHGSLEEALKWNGARDVKSPADRLLMVIDWVAAEAADPARRAARMRRDARAFDAKADRVLAEHVDLEGRSMFKRARGEPMAAAELERQAEICLRVYEKAEAASFKLKLRACELEARAYAAQALTGVALSAVA